MASIFALLCIERADLLPAKQFGVTDDVGERRAQFIGNVVDEIVAQTLRILDRLRVFHGRGHICEGQKRCAVGERCACGIEDEIVVAIHAQVVAVARVVQSRDD